MLRLTRLLAITLAMAGCAAPVPPDPRGNASEFPPTAQVEALRLPHDDYSFSLAALYTTSNARDLLTRECMTARGLTWEIIKRPTDLKDLRNRRRYGVIERRIAQQFGYHVPAGLLAPIDVEHQYDKRESSLSESQQADAFGEAGCGHEAVKQLRPADSPDPGLLAQLSLESLENSQQEPQVAAVMESWRDCMRQRGFTYNDPFAALSDPKWWADDSAGPSKQEMAVAVADVHCKEQTGLVEAWHAAEVRIQAASIAAHPDYFQKLRAAMEAELTAARAVLARSAG